MTVAMKRAVIDGLDEEWEVLADGTLVCPCGHRVEDDGECPNGHTSPLIRAGMI